MSTSSVSQKPLSILVVGATGGLGKSLVHECLARGHSLSVLVRNQDKLAVVFAETVFSLPASNIFIGDAATDTDIVKKACEGQDVVLMGVGGAEDVARIVAEQSKVAGVKKIVHVAGLTNIMDDDGTTPMWKKIISSWPPAEEAFIAHGKCIDAIRATGINYVVFCPGYMSGKGKKSSPMITPKINRDCGDHVSYEDAAHVMMDAAEKSNWDGELITAATINI
ncbi:hypothetical protein MP228_012477 [Amoeboaphelidium protococcarum]|nr:hypothetical protein MP228_012477 [Amoeboaphelidium protococcarum]